MNRPQPDEFAAFYKKYIDTVSTDVIAELRQQASSFPGFIQAIPEQKGDFAYAEGKWTIKELIGHILDTERIMAYRALRTGRNDKTPLAGFEENDYAEASHYGNRTLESLAAEFSQLRQANLFLLESFTEEELSQAGTANGSPISCRALLFIMVGHVNHHTGILKERYLLGN